MSDLISRQAAIDALGDEPEVWRDDYEYAQGLNNQWHYDVNALKALPSARPERKTGEWIVDGEYIDCSVCRREKWSRVPYENLVKGFKYCPNCGAAMKGGALK